MAELHDVADTATSLTYGVAVAALAGELLLLRILGERVGRLDRLLAAGSIPELGAVHRRASSRKRRKKKAKS